MINKSESSVKLFSFLKLFAIIVVGLGQLFLLKNILKNSSKGYEPVWFLYSIIFVIKHWDKEKLTFYICVN